MAKYRAKEKGFDGMKLVQEGEVFDFKGNPGHWMEPLDAEAKAKIAKLKPLKNRRIHGTGPKQPDAIKKPLSDGKDAQDGEGSDSHPSDGKSAI